ncbi:hypothetical protein H4219_000140 [Mycoemilia scoparia]|uniref:Histone deacetylase complex subunit SAP30 Sin3 binding domain-containing protein n=1 Tax=Mycoemilia scoparia TaxID=417184 RepID=A0A9W8ABQ7_9FUNG|nr:hypothetical protein H4219_000140 [Mycoemilia scoparia]
MAPRSKAVSSQANNNGRGGQGSPAQAFKTSRNGTQAGPSSGSQVDFNTLNIQVLRKYRQVFKLNVKARSSKDELVGAVTHHFNGHVVDEVDTIARFLYSIRTKGKLLPLYHPSLCRA